MLYDNGLNTKDAGSDPLLLRRQLLSVSFERNIMGSTGPSRLQVVLPLDLSSAVALAGGGGGEGREDATLCDKWRDGRCDGLL